MIEWRCFDLEAELYGGRTYAPTGGRISVPEGVGIWELDPDPDVIRKYLRV